jgi:hypothetical protein
MGTQLFSAAPEMCDGKKDRRNSGVHAMQPKEPSLTATAVPSLLARSIEAFYRDLAELLTTHYGKWIAYHGDERVGTGRSETELYEQCLRRGFKEDEFIVLFADNQAQYDHLEIALPPER